MSFLKDLASGNPFGTPTGQLIEKATDGSQDSEDWALMMEICDFIVQSEDGPKDAVKAIKKRLSSNAGKNATVVSYTLTVLETCVKNCGHRFHIQVAHKDFLQELLKVIAPKNEPSADLQERVLGMIQSWADAFQGHPELKEVPKIYQELKSKGVEFPMTNLDSMPPINTPAKTVNHSNTYSELPARVPSTRPAAAPAYQGHQPAPPSYPGPPSTASGYQVRHGHPVQTSYPPPVASPVTLGAPQLSKLKSELDVVQQNCKVFSEMLSEMNPAQENPADYQLLKELNSTCHQMQQRIVALVEQVQNEEVTFELLLINDELNNVFLRFERYERQRTGQTAPSFTSPTYDFGPPPTYDFGPVQPSSSPISHSAAFQAPPQRVENLIDFDDVTPNQRIAGLNISSSVSGTLRQLQSTPAATPSEEDFDMFAASRTAYGDSRATSNHSEVYKNQQQDQFQGGLSQAVNSRATGEDLAKEEEFQEMEQWLKENPGHELASATSSEFDEFLTQRAAAATSQQTAARTNKRQIKTEEENTLFAL